MVSEHILVLDGATTPGREVVGGKGESVARMRALGLPVPPAFVLPIEECRRYHAAGRRLDGATWAAVLEGVAVLEEATGRRLGDPRAPLLVSVRSGAAVSMPGMMDTILNLGMTDEVQRGLAELSGDAEFARETHVRFCHEFGHTVLGADIDAPADRAGVEAVREAVRDDTGSDIPTDPGDQLRAAIHAVFDSWSSRRAVAYRKHWGIPEDGGTAVIVQAMVFGNLGEASGTGVLFTRDPLSGARLAARDCRRYRRPRSTVNSMSCTSRCSRSSRRPASSSSRWTSGISARSAERGLGSWVPATTSSPCPPASQSP
jgi:pyruvate, orthophosphate dikinase